MFFQCINIRQIPWEASVFNTSLGTWRILMHAKPCLIPILAYSWGRHAILVADKGRGGGGYFFCFFTFIPIPLSSLSLSFISSTTSFLPFSGRRHKTVHKGSCVVKPQHNQSMIPLNRHLFRPLNTFLKYVARENGLTLIHIRILD